LNVREAIAKVKKDLAAITNLELNGMVGVSKEGDEWKITIELIERKSIPDTSDILGVYEVRLDDAGEITGFSRVRLRRRGETGEEPREGL
jgi:hypothetical protein